MSTETHYLNLIQHSAGDEGWTSDMNNNLDKIDSAIDAALGSNVIINGGFEVAQRGTSFQVTNADQYTIDRWSAFANGGSTVSVSQQEFEIGQTDVSGSPKNYVKVEITTGGITQLVTRIEDVHTFSNESVSFSFYAKADSPFTTKVVLYQLFGSGGSDFVPVDYISYNITTSWQKFEFTFNVPPIIGKTVGQGSYLQANLFREEATTENATLYFAQAQLNAGNVALPYSSRPKALEELLCQRYFINATNSSKNPCSGIASSETPSVISGQQYPVTMRTTPTLSIYNYTNSSYVRDTHSGAGITLTTPIILFGGTRRGFPGIYDPVSNPFIGGKLYDYGYVADAELY